MKLETFPDFLVIGAQKAGTTWLYHNLRTHPQIWMPKEKELHYFDEKIKLEGGLRSRLCGDRPADRRWRRQVKTRLKKFPKNTALQDVMWDLNYFFGTPADDWYASLFKPGKNQIAGEVTPDYSILHKDAIAHVHELMSRAKIILMIRNPIERPWSVADMGLRNSGRSVKAISDKNLYRWADNKRVRRMTNYLRTLKNWNAFYPEEQIFVGFLEDIHFYPGELLESVYEFLGVNSSFKPPEIDKKIHSGFNSTMPARFAAHLANSYYEEARRLSESFGGYASFWLHCADSLIEDLPNEEQIPYPLCESPLWEEWKEGREVAMQSGPLSSVWSASR